MSIIKMIENEIIIEKRVLDKYKSAKEPLNILISRIKKGRFRFFIREPGSKKQKLIPRSRYKELESMYHDRLDFETSRILEGNIRILQKIQPMLSDYDSDSAAAQLPQAYRRLKGVLDEKPPEEIGAIQPDTAAPAASATPADPSRADERDSSPKPICKDDLDKANVPQSQNPYDRKKLTVRTKFDLWVRSKNEMHIAEALFDVGARFLYEARLELVKESVGANGKTVYNTEVLYPDFTIFLPDGEVIYWEHLGMWELESYREDNVKRLTLYFENGIYPPKNLILTVDGKKMPYDSSAIWRTIEGMILSRY